MEMGALRHLVAEADRHVTHPIGCLFVLQRTTVGQEGEDEKVQAGRNQGMGWGSISEA